MKTLEQIRNKIKQQEADVKSIAPPQHLSNKDKTRHKRLLRLLTAIESGESVANRELRTALTDDEWDDFIARKEHIAETRQDKMPDLIRDYMDILKKADFYYMRSLTTKTTERSRKDINGKVGRSRLGDKAESLYEDAYGKLEEMFDGTYVAQEQELRSWFDRDITFEHGSLIGCDTANIPRIKGSKSKHSQQISIKQNEFEQRRDTKKHIIIQSLKTLLGIDETINYENTNKHTTGSVKLRELLQNDDDDII